MIIRLNRPLKNARLINILSPAQTQAVAAAATLPSRVADPQPVAPANPGLAESDLLELFQSIEDRFAELEARRQQSLNELRELAIEVAIAATHKVAHEAVDSETFPLERTIDRMIAEFTTDEPTTIWVNPAHLATLQKHFVAGESGDALNDKLRIQKRADLPPGSCLVQSPKHSVFFEIDTILASLRQRLLESLDASETERRATSPANKLLQRFPDRRSVG